MIVPIDIQEQVFDAAYEAFSFFHLMMRRQHQSEDHPCWKVLEELHDALVDLDPNTCPHCGGSLDFHDGDGGCGRMDDLYL